MTDTTSTSAIGGTAIGGRTIGGVIREAVGGLERHQEGGVLDANKATVWTEDSIATTWTPADIA